MAIEDEELREIFQEASEEELRKMKEGLAHFREHPDDERTLEDLLRESHSLKGNAGMLGLKDIATLSQQWEHLIESVQQGKTPFSQDLCDRLTRSLDAIERLVREAITGEPSGVQTFYILADLMGASDRNDIRDSQTHPEAIPEAQPLEPEPDTTPEPEPALDFDEELHHLEAGLLALEQESGNRDRLDELVDTTETLIERANQLELDAIVQIGRHWLESLQQLQQGEGDFDEQCDRLYAGLDDLRTHLHAPASQPLPPKAPPSPEPEPEPEPEPLPDLGQVNYIEDDELRETFKIASEDHLQKLYDGLLSLEQNPQDAGQLDDILRDIHSLKGDAGMLGVQVVAQLSHQWEQQLAPVKAGSTTLDNDLCDRLFTHLDTIRQLVNQAVTPPEERTPTPTPIPDPATDTVSQRYIDDDELRETFQITSEDHLQKLDTGLLHLEKNPGDTAKLDEVLREIHSIKGDAGMLGIEDIAHFAHEWEQQLIPVKSGSASFNSALCDRLYSGLDALRQLIREATSGTPSGLTLDNLLSQLRGQATASPATPVVSTPTSQLPTPSSSSSNQQDGSYRIDTIRVATRNLDALMTTSGELTVTKIRIAHRLAEIEEMVALWEEWSRDAFSNRFLWEDLQSHQNGNGRRNGSLATLQSFQQQSEERLERLGGLLERLHNAITEDTARLDTLANDIEDGVRTLRLLPLSTIFNLYPRLVRDLARSQKKDVHLVISGGDTRADKRILEEMKDPLTHIIRNAIDHGIEPPEERERLGKPRTATITVRGYQTASTIAIEISDDGRGLNLEKIKKTALKNGVCREDELAAMTDAQIQSLIFMPGFSTRSFVTEVSGRGVGLDVVRANVERLKGSVRVASELGKGTTIYLQLGTTLATAHVLLLEVEHHPYALPVEFVQTACTIAEDDIFSLEGRPTILYDGQPISVARLADILELDREPGETEARSLACIILKVGEDWLGLIVDRLIDEQDAILKPQSKILKRVRNISGATILGTGEVCMVLNPIDIVQSVRAGTPGAAVRVTPKTPTADRSTAEPQKQTILLVEDSITTRTQEKRILEAAGYEVVTAVDGLDGYNKLRNRDFDAVVSDIQMPKLDGLEMTARIRSHQHYSELPIVLVTSLATDEDRRKGAEAGANAYITKSSFNQDVLVETLHRLI